MLLAGKNNQTGRDSHGKSLCTIALRNFQCPDVLSLVGEFLSGYFGVHRIRT